MDFNFNEEQSLIQGQVSQFIQRDYDWEKRQELSNSERGFSDENWKQFGELGWLGISISEASGGFGGSSLDTMIIMEEFGKGLVVEPFLETIVLSASIIDEAGSQQQKDEVLNKVIEGNPDAIKTVNDVWKFSKNMWSLDPTWYLVETTNK